MTTIRQEITSNSSYEIIASRNIPNQLTHSIKRPKIVEALLSNPCRLRLLHAPAGYGKTTLMADCARERKHPVVWISMGGREISPRDFINLLGSILFPNIPIFDEEILLTELSRAHEQTWIMLDDYPRNLDHELDALVGRLLLTHNGHVEWWISSRRRLRCNLPRLMLDNALIELHAEQMMFNEMEISELITLYGNSTLNSLDLFKNTHGWCAAVVFRIISPHSSEKLVSEYLKYEVLEKLTIDQQSTLVVLANIAKFDNDLCEYLFGIAETDQFFKSFTHNELFIGAIPDAPEWMHVMPAAANALASFASVFDLRQKHRAACQRFIQRGEHLLAIEQAILADHYETAASLLVELANEELLTEKSIKKILNYWDRLPIELIQSSVELVTIFALAFALADKPQNATTCLAEISKFLPAITENQQSRIASYWLSIKGFSAVSQGDSELAKRYCLEALSCLDFKEHYLRLSCHIIVIQQEIFQGNLHQSEIYLREATEFAQSAKNMNSICLINIYTSILLESKGHLTAAREIIDQQLHAIKYHPPVQPAVKGRLMLRQGNIAMLQGRLKEANQLLSEAYKFCTLNMESIGFHGLVGLSTLALHDGLIDRAKDLLDQAENFVRSFDVTEMTYRSLLDQARVSVAIESGNFDTAQKLLDILVARHMSPAGPIQTFVSSDFLYKTQCLLVRVQLQKGQILQAEQRLTVLFNQALESDSQLSVCEVELLQAEIFLIRGQEKLASEITSSVVRRCDSLGFLLPIERLKKRSSKLFKLTSIGACNELLSQREITVLRLVESGLSNREIAEKLNISLYTVKSHNQRLSGKLEVKRRTQAVSKAKTLGLI